MNTEKLFAFGLRAVLWPCPRGACLRIARRLYNFDHPAVRGFETTVLYLKYLRFKLNTKDAIGWMVFYSGSYEPKTNAAIRAACRPGDVVIDAGANNGTETLLTALLVGTQGRVYAFEPVPHVLRQLTENVQLNKLGNVVSLEGIALGTEDGEISFHLMPYSAPNQGMSSQFAFSASRETIRVRQRTLDGWAADRRLDRLDFLKMDIQGGELGLLEGGRATIARHLPVIFAEAEAGEQEQAGRSLAALWRHLVDAGYDVWSYGHRRHSPRPFRAPEDLKEGNWIAMPQKKRGLLAPIRAQLGLAE